jgi:uncharacterized protein involved in response to NO
MISAYRVFFPLGIIYGIWGASIWIALWLGLAVDNMIQVHGEIMFGGFLFSFIAGFLLTATPKYTGSKTVSFWEFYSFISLQIAFIFAIISNSIILFHIIEFLSYILLFWFVLYRFVYRSQHLYPYYIFLLIGLAQGVCALGFLLFNHYIKLDMTTIQMLKGIYYEGMMLSIIIGVGSSLIPTLIGYKGETVLSLSISGTKINDQFVKSISRIMWVLITLFISSFYIEYHLDYHIGRFTRLIILFIILNNKIKLFKRTPSNSYFSQSIWLSVWMLIISQALTLTFETYKIHFLHFTFLSSFTLISLIIAARISLAHGNHGFNLEQRSKVYYLLVSLITISAVTRVTAIFIPSRYFSHLAYAAIFLILALVMWSVYFIPKILNYKE